MNALFEVGAKLLGLYFVYRGVLALVDVAASLLSSLNQDATGLGLYLVFTSLAALVQVGAGGLLFSQTAWFARLGRLSGRGDVLAEVPTKVLTSVDELLPLGIVLIGVGTFVGALGPFITGFFLYFFRDTFGPPDSLRGVWVGGLTLASALGLVFFAKRVAALVTWR